MHNIIRLCGHGVQGARAGDQFHAMAMIYVTAACQLFLSRLSVSIHHADKNSDTINKWQISQAKHRQRRTFETSDISYAIIVRDLEVFSFPAAQSGTKGPKTRGG